MSSFREISPYEMSINPFKMFGKDWTLAAAKKDGKVNMLTAAWGGLGIMWSKPVVYIFIRKSRYTHEFMDAAGEFSLGFFDESFRDKLNFCGKNSGRDIDKVAECGFTVLEDAETPYFAEANTAVICKKLARHLIESDGFIDPDIARHYTDGDYHDLYIGEIVKVLVK